MRRIFIFLLIFSFSFTTAYGALSERDAVITYGGVGLEEIIFDGKWTTRFEWKPSTLTEVRYDDGHEMVIRLSHDYENIFAQINFVTYTPVVNLKDKVTICFDNNQIPPIRPNENTFCFVQIMGKHEPYTLQGGSNLASTGFFQKINNHPDLIGVGNLSDENDRYSKIPHTSYEFKIPIEVIGRSNIYGFYVNVFADRADREYTWPDHTTSTKYPFIPQPNTWGEMVSPDKSIPEFNIPFYVLITMLLGTIIITKIKFQKMIGLK